MTSGGLAATDAERRGGAAQRAERSSGPARRPRGLLSPRRLHVGQFVPVLVHPVGQPIGYELDVLGTLLVAVGRVGDREAASELRSFGQEAFRDSDLDAV